jgi:esterase
MIEINEYAPLSDIFRPSQAGASLMSYFPPKWPIPSDAKWIQVNGYPMAYQDRGAGVPLILVHGSLCDYRMWQGQLEAFSRTHRVLNVSLRHYFPELWDGEGNDFSVTQHGQDVGVFIQQLALGRVHLLGHSRGGAVAFEVAKKCPELIQTLILADPVARLDLPETESSRKAVAFRSKLLGDLRQDVAKGDIKDGTARFINGLTGAGSWESLPDALQKVCLQNVQTELAGDRFPLVADGELQKFDFPVLTLTGENSAPFYGFLISEMRKRGGFKPPVIIPGAGHAMNIQNPNAFNKAVLKFTAEQ